MKLSLLLLGRLTRGSMWRGKDRLTPIVTPNRQKQYEQWLRQEEQNMLLLRYPFLTLDESWGHGIALGKPQAWLAKKKLENQKFKPNVTTEERYESLKCGDNWGD